MKELFYELIKEASLGSVFISGEDWPIYFNTVTPNDNYITNPNIPTLTIKNEDEFFNLLSEYINLELNLKRKSIPYIDDKNLIKLIIAYLFINATTEDFSNPETLLKRNIEFLKDNTFVNLDDKINLNELLNSQLSITNIKQSLLMETPYKIDLTLSKDDCHYPLPSISYGITEENNQKVCYVYSIINPKYKLKSKDEETYHKKIKRLLYKLNNGITESNEYLEYKNNISNYYPENISDVTPSFILSLTIFISLLQKENISTIKVVPFLPLRYISREISSQNKEFLITRNDNIQNNITNKFIRTFFRIAYHIKNLKINSLPYELDEFLTLNLENNITINNEILNDINNCIMEDNNTKTK